MDLTKASSWATIVGVPLAIVGLIIAIFPSEAHDYAVKRLDAILDISPRAEPPIPGPTFAPPDLEGRKWDVHIRASGYPAFEGQTKTPFLANNTYEAVGHFLVPTLAVDQHIDCPASVQGHWHYANANHTQLALDMSIGSVGGRTEDEFKQCEATLQHFQAERTTVSATCTFSNPGLCTSSKLEIHLTPLQ
jgi:hypothetical protein